MKNMIKLFAMFVLCLTVSYQVSAANWEMTFDDEFDGNALDLTKWSKGYPWPAEWANESSLQVYVDNAVTVANGICTIKSDNNSGDPARPYTSGMISTRNLNTTDDYLFSQTYGRFEMRCRIANGQGFWNAFWLFPIVGGWQSELDIFEILGHDSNIQYMTHWLDQAHVTQDSFNGRNFSDAFHEFAVEWSANNITWFVDGQPVLVYNDNGAGKIYHNPMFIIVNLAVGGNWPGSPDATTQFPASMQLDYVRAYKRGTVPNSTPSITGLVFGSGTNVTEGDDVFVKAEAAGNVEKMEFYVNNKLIATDPTAPYEAVLYDVVRGNYTVRAKAVSSTGTVANSVDYSLNVAAITLNNALVIEDFEDISDVGNYVGGGSTLNLNPLAGIINNGLNINYTTGGYWGVMFNKTFNLNNYDGLWFYNKSDSQGLVTINLHEDSATPGTTRAWTFKMFPSKYWSAVYIPFDKFSCNNATAPMQRTNVTRISFDGGSISDNFNVDELYAFNAITANNTPPIQYGNSNPPPPATDSVGLNSPPTTVTAGLAYNVNIDFSSSDTVEGFVQIRLFKTGTPAPIAYNTITISAGSNQTTTLNITVPADAVNSDSNNSYFWEVTLFDHNWSGVANDQQTVTIGQNNPPPPATDSVSLNSPPATVTAGLAYNVNIDFSSSDTVEGFVQIRLFKTGTPAPIAYNTATISAGNNQTTTLNITVPADAVNSDSNNSYFWEVTLFDHNWSGVVNDQQTVTIQ